MKRKRSPVQTKLNFQIPNKCKTCPECKKEIDNKLFEFHAGSSDCKENLTQELKPNIAPSPISTTRFTQKSFTSPNPSSLNAYDILMSTPQANLSQSFNLSYLGESSGRQKWACLIENKPSGTFISRKYFLKESSHDPCQIILTASTSHQAKSPLSFYDFFRLQAFSPSIIKSCLQKSIRQGIRNKAIKLAFQMAVNCGIRELCRRLCIIVLEDSLLHPDYPLLVWCMVAGEEYQFSQEILESIIQIVADISTVSYRDYIYVEKRNNLFTQWNSSNDIVKAILIRTYYKGMKGDMEMLSRYAMQWMERFNANNEWIEIIRKIYYELPIWTEIEINGGLKIEDIPLQGIDFHCSNMLDILLEDQIFIAQLEEALNKPRSQLKDYLHEAIWTQRSGVNYRKYFNEYSSELATSLPAPDQDQPEPDEVFNSLVLPKINEFSSGEISKRFRKSLKLLNQA
ncbi:unnamed protein product [Blepharisma stoltei]|uniref:Uncharacterized protein n=1 Tax=Blepharisma stoltei TaxID=1481888 RepID=A0AAU9IKK9_9CILI|nr:unnamed protein product [Blepharisma stoltei]